MHVELAASFDSERVTRRSRSDIHERRPRREGRNHALATFGHRGAGNLVATIGGAQHHEDLVVAGVALEGKDTGVAIVGVGLAIM